MVEVENSRIGKNDPSFHFGIIRCILAGNDRDFPVFVPKQSDFRMNGSAAIVEAAGNHLKRFRAYAPDAVINKQLKREQFVVFDVVLKLLNAFIRKGIGCHE